MVAQKEKRKGNCILKMIKIYWRQSRKIENGYIKIINKYAKHMNHTHTTHYIIYLNRHWISEAHKKSGEMDNKY